MSIGRTPAEAEARPASTPVWPTSAISVEDGLFGTLETAQARVVELAHAGVTDLRCALPDVPDVHDVVAQLTAVVVGHARHPPPGRRSLGRPEPPSWAAPRPD